MRAITIILVTALLAGCVDDADVGDVESVDTTAAELTAPGCLGNVFVTGKLPAYSPWTGAVPAPVSSSQVWIVHPLDSQGAFFAGYQVNWQAGKVTWAVKVTGAQRAALQVAMGRSLGRIGGVRNPPPPPPPDGGDWLKLVVAHAKGVHLAYDKALTMDPCLGTIAVNAPMPPYSPWTGTLPPTASTKQVWTYHPLDAQGAWWAGHQVDWVNGRVAWATVVSSQQLPQLINAFSTAVHGRIGGVRNPPPPPPPDGGDWAAFEIAFAKGIHVSFEQAIAAGGLK